MSRLLGNARDHSIVQEQRHPDHIPEPRNTKAHLMSAYFLNEQSVGIY